MKSQKHKPANLLPNSKMEVKHKHQTMTVEERTKEILKDLFEKHGITDECAKGEFVNKLLESRVILGYTSQN